MTEKEFPILGVDEAVYDAKGDLLGYCGFHEFDGYIPKPSLEMKVRKLANLVGTGIYVFKTGYGYHFDSFEIMDKEKHRKWKLACREIFPSDYGDNLCPEDLTELTPLEDGGAVCAKCGHKEKVHFKRVLRVSLKPTPKGGYKTPEFLVAWHGYSSNPVKFSGAHVKVYRETGVFPEIFHLEDSVKHSGMEVEIVDTRCMLCTYLTQSHIGKPSETEV